MPAEYAALIPAIAYTIPDLDGMAKLVLNTISNNSSLACIQSAVTNTKTLSSPAVSYVAAGVAGAALLVSGISALATIGSIAHGASSSGAGATTSPTFMETIGWFQSMAMNGMLSVKYPSVYRAFTQNFGFSTGLVSWQSLQDTIDNFRAATGGNLTDDSVAYLRSSTLMWQTGSSSSKKRALDMLSASNMIRDIVTTVNGTTSTLGGNGTAGANTTTTVSKPINFVHGIQGYVEQLSIPQSNTFMTVLLVFSCIVAAITAGILLLKVILEAWALFASFPKRLTSFRKRYWWLLAKTITNLVLLLYGSWTLYCVYQFRIGDSWAAKLLAGLTLALFTSLLLAFTVVIFRKAHTSRKADGSVDSLYSNKEVWQRYSLFYESYKTSYWWAFVPAIVYMFAKGCVIAGADGHGLAQTAGQLIIESLYLTLILVLRPYTLPSGNWINVIIQAVRVISVVCILVFVEELGVSQTTRTITGLVLVITQSALTATLAILIAANSIIACVKMNPHRRRRKEEELRRRKLDERAASPGDDDDDWDPRADVLPLPSLPLGHKAKNAPIVSTRPVDEAHPRGRLYRGAGFGVPYSPVAPREFEPTRPPPPPTIVDRAEARLRDGSTDRLVGTPMGRVRTGSGAGSDVESVREHGPRRPGGETAYQGRGGYWI